MQPINGAEARALADDVSEAIRTLSHATQPADGWAALRYPADVYDVLGSLHQAAYRLPQLCLQVSAFLQWLLQHELIAIDAGEHLDDPLGAVGTASCALEIHAAEAALRLASALGAAQQAIAFASYTGTPFDDER